MFGSVVRGDARPDRDVDFLIDAEPVTSSWFPAGVVQELQSLLGRRVEVVTERGLNNLIRDEVLREAVLCLTDDCGSACGLTLLGKRKTLSRGTFKSSRRALSGFPAS